MLVMSNQMSATTCTHEWTVKILHIPHFAGALTAASDWHMHITHTPAEHVFYQGLKNVHFALTIPVETWGWFYHRFQHWRWCHPLFHRHQCSSTAGLDLPIECCCCRLWQWTTFACRHHRKPRSVRCMCRHRAVVVTCSVATALILWALLVFLHF